MFAVDDWGFEEWVPESLDSMEPGHELACALSAINVKDCTPYDQIRVLKAHERMRNFYSAHLYQAMTAVVDSVDPEDMSGEFVEEAAAAEVAAALKWTRRAADTEMGYAVDLRERLPQVWAALFAGTIDLRRAKVLINGTTHLPAEEARRVVDSIMDKAHRYTTGQLQARLRKLCIDTNPNDAEERYESAVEQRYVASQPDESGTANLYGINLPPHRVAAALQRIDDLAKARQTPGETRTIDQLRADVLLDILEGFHEGSKGGTVVIHVTLESLARLSDESGDLAGYGPVVADIARQVAERQRRGEWRFVLDDASTGLPLDVGTTRRRPTAGQQRMVETRSPTCVHPGCRMPAAQSDIDHTRPWSKERRTQVDNLAPLCRFHHRIKHEAGWRYEPVGDGDYVFTTPTGHRYTTSGRSP